MCRPGVDSPKLPAWDTRCPAWSTKPWSCWTLRSPIHPHENKAPCQGVGDPGPALAVPVWAAGPLHLTTLSLSADSPAGPPGGLDRRHYEGR